MSESEQSPVKKERFTAISGWGMVICSLLIPLIAYIAAEWSFGWLNTWVAGVAVCGVIMTVMTRRKLKRAPGPPKFSRTGRVLGGFVPEAFICAGLTAMLYSSHEEWLPIIWLSCYGIMLIVCGIGSPWSLRILGALILALNYPFWTEFVHYGLTPVPNLGNITPGDALLVIGLGIIQLPFGLYIALRYKG